MQTGRIFNSEGAIAFYALIFCIFGVVVALTGCTHLEPEYVPPPLLEDEYAHIEGSRHLIASPQMEQKNVDISSIDGLRLLPNATQLEPGKHTIKVVIYWGAPAGPAADRYSKVETFTMQAEADHTYRVKAALHGGTIFGRDATRYWWVEDLTTGDVVSGKAPSGKY